MEQNVLPILPPGLAKENKTRIDVAIILIFTRIKFVGTFCLFY